MVVVMKVNFSFLLCAADFSIGLQFGQWVHQKKTETNSKYRI